MALEYVKIDFERFLRHRRLEGWPLEGIELVAFPCSGHQPIGWLGLPDAPSLPERLDLDAATSDESGITFDSSEGLKTTTIGKIDDLSDLGHPSWDRSGLPLGVFGPEEERWWFVPEFTVEELPFDHSYKTLLRENTFVCGPGAAGIEGTDLQLLEQLHPNSSHRLENKFGGIPFPMVLEMIKITTARNVYTSAKAVRLNLGDSFDRPPGLGTFPLVTGDRDVDEVKIPQETKKERIIGIVRRISPGLGRKLSSRKLRP